MKNNQRFYQVDLLRIIAATSVLLFHYTFRGYAADNMTVLSFPYMGVFSRYGYLGYYLFFIVSGFVILLTAFNKNGLGFVISRIVRLYPAYWVCVTLTYFLIITIGGPRYDAHFLQYLANLTMIHGYIGIEHLDPVYWTLLVELKFYFLIIILVSLRQIRYIKYYLGAWLALTIILSEYQIKYLDFFLFPDWSCYFIAGACFYLVHREGKSFYNLFLIVITYVLAIFKQVAGMPILLNHYNTEFNIIIIIAIVTLMYISFYAISTNNAQFFNKIIFLILGALTYPLYLIHQYIGYMLINLLAPYMNKYVVLVVVILTMYTSAYLIHKYIEKEYSRSFKRFLTESGDYLVNFLTRPLNNL